MTPTKLHLFWNWLSGGHDHEPVHHIQLYIQMLCHLLNQYVHSLNIPPEYIHKLCHTTNDEFETWFNENVPLNLHALLLVHPRQVHSATTNTPTTPTVSNSPAFSQ